MASSKFAVLPAILLLLLPMVANGNRDGSFPPSLSPYAKEMCDEVTCGKGKCKEAWGKPFNFVCECDAGWKRTRLSDEDDLQFLPCVIPNCSVDYNCMPAAPPAPSFPYNFSVFDPCYWMYCGEGSCSMNSTYRHTCKCNRGYSNLLDVAAFPCYSECAVGSDCQQKLGISVSKSSSSTPSNDSNLATSASVPRMLLCMAISLVSSVAVLQWK